MDRILYRTKRSRIWHSVRENYVLAVIATIVILITLVIIILIVTMDRTKKPGKAKPDRIECPGFTEADCTRKLCKYEKVSEGPSCFMEKDSFGYVVQAVTEYQDGPLIQLQRRSNNTPYGPSMENVAFKVTYLTENILRFQFKDSNKERYEVPIQDQFPLLQYPTNVSESSNLTYKIAHSSQSQIFHFQVTRTDGSILWDTGIGGLLLSDQYLQIASYLPSNNVYGLGEHARDSLRHKMNFVTWPMFSKDSPPNLCGESKSLYGVHPFYTCLEKSGKSHGVFFLNSNAMEVTLMPAPAISFRTIGGILDFFIFVGDNPEHVIQLYTSLIGRPMMPPYWGLGFQLSRYGYKKLSDLNDAIERTRNAKIPLAVQYLDIDHMQDNKDFTYNNKLFPDLPTYVNKQKTEYGLKWIPIVDPAMDSDASYGPYTSGLQQSVYIKRHPSWKPSMFPKDLENVNVTFGKVWTRNYAAFPDFFLPETVAWWKQLILDYQKVISFDGIWIDMNEPANFGTNEESPKYCEYDKKDCWSLKCPQSRYEDPPYNPLLKTDKARISQKTLCMESVQGNSTSPYLHYDVHSLYGLSQIQPTYEAAQAATNTRSLVISRSTYPSSGRYAGHWLGDNHSTYRDLKASIIGMLEFNMFGIPYVGADVCGFFYESSPELCKLWMQLGAFYPFYRNHNNIDQKAQDPAVFGPEVAEASRKAVERRITLNPYLYTLFYKAHVYGTTVVRPVFHEFPLDENTWDMSTQFMWGQHLLITPFLEQNRNAIAMYLPKSEWWHFDIEKFRQESRIGKHVILANTEESTPVHIRGGAIFPMTKYDPENYPGNSTVTDISLYVFPYQDQASGDLFIDDGISINTIENEAYALYQFTYNNCLLTITPLEYAKFAGPYTVLDEVVVFKVKEIASVPDYNFTTNPEHNSATITVQSAIGNVQQIQWAGNDGSCQMLP